MASRNVPTATGGPVRLSRVESVADTATVATTAIVTRTTGCQDTTRNHTASAVPTTRAANTGSRQPSPA